MQVPGPARPQCHPDLGLLGALLILTSATVTIFGGWEQVPLVRALCMLPIAAWDFSLAVWLTVEGFRTTPLTLTTDREALPVG